MSSSGAEHTAAANRSGRWVTAAPVSSPPLDPPHTASRSRAVIPEAIRCSAAAWKSSNTFCLRSSIPARCHSWPSSPPPRSPAIAYTPPASTQARMLAE
jgi:hypothetical protein